MTEPALFDMAPAQIPALTPPGLSADQRRTHRQHEDIVRGVHPLARIVSTIVIHPDADRNAHAHDGRKVLRCGSCQWRELVRNHDRAYPKCMNPHGTDSTWPNLPAVSRGAATDCRAWWPACTRYEEAS